jgi:hypothetical protein
MDGNLRTTSASIPVTIRKATVCLVVDNRLDYYKHIGAVILLANLQSELAVTSAVDYAGPTECRLTAWKNASALQQEGKNN